MDRDLSQNLVALNASEAQCTDVPGRGRATTTIPEMRAGNVCLCLGTLVAGASSKGGAARFTFSAVDIANSFAMGQLNYYERLMARGEVRLIRTRGDLEDHIANWKRNNNEQRSELPIGVIVAFEGCDSVSSPMEADVWYARGVRCASLVHYGHGRYAGGTGTNDPLTPSGRELLLQFKRLGVILDLTHLSDQAFGEVAGVFDGPIFASHQNCRALCRAVDNLPMSN